jgi:hypothetical protein
MNLNPLRFRRGLVSLATVGAVTLGLAGAGLVTAGPALADPVNNYVGVGSNTTQDVMNAFAALVGDGTIGSYDAVAPLTGDSYNTIPEDNVEIAPEKQPFGVDNTTGETTKCDFTRPNDSGAGIAALMYGVNPNFRQPSTEFDISITSYLPPAPNSGTQEPGYACIDFARSSSGPPTNADGDLLYIPFGGDVLATATGPSTGGTTTIYGTSVSYLPTAITDAGEFSETDLKTLYNCDDILTQGTSDYTTVTVPDGDTYGEAGSTTYYVRTTSITSPPTIEPDAIPVDLEVPSTLPGFGSGTGLTWLVDLTGDAAVPPCVNQTIVNASAGNASFDGDPVEENNGLVYTVDPNALGPLSVAQVIAQDSGYGEWRLGAAVVHDMATASAPTTPIAPYTGTLGNYNASGGTSTGNAKINPMYPIWGLVYNVVLAGRILGTPGPGGTNGTTQYMDAAGNPDGTYDAGLAALFAGTSSALCSSSILIGRYGFATLPQDTRAGVTVGCGDTSSVELAIPSLTASLPSGYPAPY